VTDTRARFTRFERQRIGPEPERVTECIAELHALTKLPRTGWSLAGVVNPETVATHCYESAVIAYILTRHVGRPVDVAKVLAMALFHEVGETRLTDLPRRSAPYIRSAKGPAERSIAVDVLSGVAEDVIPLLDEFNQCETLEAQIAEAAEELQIIIAAAMYAKERNGDMSEYVQDAQNYDSQGIELAERIAEVVRERLGSYLGSHPYWELGYRRTD
jgi:putative hydrolase of HD superfamily